MAAVSTNEVKLLLRQGIPARQADALADWLEATQTALDTLCDKLDADGGVTDTNYATTVAAILTD